MYQISLVEARRLLEEATAVLVDKTVTFPTLEELTGDPENEWLLLVWEFEGCEFAVKFTEEPRPIWFDGSQLRMVDHEGDVVDIILLTPRNEWVPIVTAPRDEVCLVNDTNYDRGAWAPARWVTYVARPKSGSEGRWIYDDEELQKLFPQGPEPTHWLPVPPL